MLKKRIILFIVVNILFHTAAAAGWTWEDEDPLFCPVCPTPRPTTKPISTTTSVPTTTSTSSPTTTSTSSPTTPPSPDPNFRKCLKRCPTTSEYNPICGTDSMTYTNEGKLLCARKCGRTVSKSFDGVCGPVTSTTIPTTTTSMQSGATPNPRCFKRCPKTQEHNPVCGTNNLTYENESRLRCSQQCGVDVQKAFDGQCSGSQSTVRPIRTTTLPANFRSCIRQCIVSSQYRPVCASDGTTYNNESEMMCDVSCGRNVQKVRDGAC